MGTGTTYGNQKKDWKNNRIKLCIKCARSINPDDDAVMCKLCKIIQTHNSKKIRKYPTSDKYIFDSLSYKRRANDLDALGMAMLQKGYIYINLAYIKETTDIDYFIQRICKVISHEVMHHAIFENEGYLTSFKMDCVDILILLNSFMGLEETYTPERIKILHDNYIIRLKSVLRI